MPSNPPDFQIFRDVPRNDTKNLFRALRAQRCLMFALKNEGQKNLSALRAEIKGGHLCFPAKMRNN